MSGYQGKNYKAYQGKNYKAYQKQKKLNNLKTKQASEQNMTGILKLSDWDFKTTMIDILRAVVDKVKSMQEQTDGQFKQRDENLKTELKGNSRGQKYCKTNKE